jgi:hypothetical protein
LIAERVGDSGGVTIESLLRARLEFARSEAAV